MSILLTPRVEEVRHFHVFCGLGGGAKGFNAGRARVGHVSAQFRCIGGVDSDRAAIADFTRLAGVPGTVLDLFSREQYRAFHGHEPPADWREATTTDLQRAAHGERPHIVFGSAPCKGFSGLLSQARSESARYQALNQLALRGLWLCLEAWKDDPPAFFIWENVPRMATRGRAVLDQMLSLVGAYDYAAVETTHDCGEIGALGQSRKRLLVVCRHRQKVPPFLYEPRRKSLRSVGDVIGAAPLPGDPSAGPMHRMRSLQWRTWVRLAFVEAGSDWRSLKRLRVEDGALADYGIVPEREWYRTALGVTPWDKPAGTVTSEARPQNGAFSVADPRPTYTGEYAQLGVCPWDRPTGTVSGQSQPGGGAYSVADPRPQTTWDGSGKYVVTPFDRPAGTVIAESGTGNGAYAVADPRLPNTAYNNIYRIVAWDEASRAVTSSGDVGVADPRCGLHRPDGAAFANAGQAYGVVPWTEPSGGVTAAAGHDNGRWSVADPRCAWSDTAHRNKLRVVSWDQPAPTVIGATRVDSGAASVADPRAAYLPAPDERLVAVIRALDGTWHRPFTTFELALLQGLIDVDEGLAFDGSSDTGWRERIGNAVPSPAAAAIASVMGETLLLAQAGETFLLSAQPIWVRPLVVALSVDAPLSPMEGVA